MSKRLISAPMLLLVIAAMLLGACDTGGAATNTPVTVATATTAAAGNTTVVSYTSEEVAAGSGKEGCSALAALPKQMKSNYTLGFINPNKGYPYWGVISAGMNAAAKFYGVNLTELDSAGDTTKLTDLMETLLLSKPVVAGTGGVGAEGEAIAVRAQEENVVYVGLDTGPSAYSPYAYGVPDAFAGKIGGDLLIEGVEARMSSDWKGRDLYYIEFTHKGVPACIPRTGAAAADFKAHFKLADDHVLQADLATGQTSPDLITSILTAHPDAVFAMIPCWDGMGIDAYNAAKDQGREKDVMMVTLGGDQPPAEMLLGKPIGYYGYVEFQPFCEGWGWVETALAIKEGVTFHPFQTRRTTTQAQIDQRYKDLYGDLKTPTPAK